MDLLHFEMRLILLLTSKKEPTIENSLAPWVSLNLVPYCKILYYI